MVRTVCSFEKYVNCHKIYDGSNLKEFIEESEDNRLLWFFNEDSLIKDKRISQMSNEELEKLFGIYKGFYIHKRESVMFKDKQYFIKDIRNGITVDEYFNNIINSSSSTNNDIINKFKEYFKLKTIRIHLKDNEDDIDKIGKWQNYEYIVVDIVQLPNVNKFLFILTKKCDTLAKALKSDNMVGIILEKDDVTNKLKVLPDFVKVLDKNEPEILNSIYQLCDWMIFDSINLDIETHYYLNFKVQYSKYFQTYKVICGDSEIELSSDHYVHNAISVKNKKYLIVSYFNAATDERYLIDEDLNEVFDDRFEEIYANNDLIILKNSKSNHKTQVIDLANKNNVIFECDKLDANNSVKQLYAFKNDDKYGFVNKNFKIVIPTQYEYGMVMSHQLLMVQLNNKFGIVDNKNRVIVPFEYDDLNIYGGYIHGTINEFDELLTLKGKRIISFNEEFKNIYTSNKRFYVTNNNMLIKQYSKTKKEIINLNTKKSFVIDNLDFVDINYFNKQGFASVKDMKTNLYGIIDKDGNVVMPCISKRKVKL